MLKQTIRERSSAWLAMFLLAVGALILTVAASPASVRLPGAFSPPSAALNALSAPNSVPVLFDDLQVRTFRYFWENADPQSGLVPDRFPSPSASSIAAVGFALTAYPIGVERGYISRAQARDRTLKTLRFFRNAPQGRSATGMSGYKGFFYHYLDMKTGRRAGDSELSTVDTALLLGGMLFCQSYFDRPDAAEVELRRLVEEIYARVDWRWAQARGSAISHGWTPEASFLAYDWHGYNEAMLVYILALGSPTHPVTPNAWQEWVRDYQHNFGTAYGQTYLSFNPLFGHQYSHVWVDFRGIQDAPMRRAGFDYFENSRRATYAHRAYAIANPMKWNGYGENVWGFTASDGSADVELTYAGEKRRFNGYCARGVGVDSAVDDGTIAPTAAIASMRWRRCTGGMASMCSANTDSSTRSIRASTTMWRCATAAAFRVSAGSIPTTWASIRVPYSR